MKKWAEKFLGSSAARGDALGKNSRTAARCKLRIPQKLYLEYSNKIPFSVLLPSICDKGDNNYTRTNTAFMAGFACGWAEKSRSIK